MKKMSLISLIGIAFLFNVGKVYAVDFKVKADATIVDIGVVKSNGFKYGNIAYDGENKYYAEYDGKQYTAYCMDPASASANNPNDYEIGRKLKQANSNIKEYKVDVGILEILKKGYNQFNNSLTLDNGATVSGDDLYLATSIAVRAFEYTHQNGRNPGLSEKYKRKASSFVSLGARWAGYYYVSENYYDIGNGLKSCANKSDAADCLDKLIKGYYSWYMPINLTPTEGTASYNVIEAAKKLYKLAVQAQKQNATNDGSEFSIKGKVDSFEDKDENGNALSEKRVYASIEVKNMNAETGYLRTLLIDCPSCKEQGITLGKVEYQFEGSSEWISDGILSETDLTLGFKRENGLKSGALKVRINYTQNNDSEDCKRVDFKISYKYFNTSDDVVGAVIKPKPEVNTSDGLQRFLVVSKSSENGDAPLDGSMEGVFNCPKNEACETEVVVPVCSDDESQSVATIKTNENIKRCILDNVDDASNSYQLIKDNGGLSDTQGVRDNDYCDIFCKEDYAEIKLNPIVKDVVCGGYFQLKSSVKGTKDCYTGGNTTDKASNGEASIDKDKYLSDIERIQSEMVSQTNIYLKNDAYANSNGTDGGEECCGPIIDVTTPEYTVYFDFDFKNENGSFDSKTTSDSESISPDCDEKEEGDGSTSCTLKESAASIYSKRKAAARDARDEAGTRLSELAEEYKQVIRDYNACTTAWTNEFKFAQEILYYYDEYKSGSDEAWTPYYDLLDDEYKKLEKDGDMKETSTITICKGTADNNYNCNGNQIELDGSIDKDKELGELNYSYAYREAFERRSYVFCNTNNCHYTNPMISQASFVKKSVSKEQNYITPTAFYQIAVNGKITVAEGFALDKVDAAELTHSLPISTGAVGGGVFRLMVKDLGEFYDTKDKLGRLIDFDEIEFNGMNPESVAYAKDKNGIKTNFDGNYKCYYESPCRPDDCPNCDFTCEGDGCEFEPCPNCVPECIGDFCMFDQDKMQITVKTISTTNFESVGRTFGYNWITSSSMKALELLNSKASKTISEIKETNEMIYQDDKTSDDSSLAFSIKMTPEVTRRIQKYNKEVTDNKEGGYLNNSLKCYDAVAGGETYSNIYCYSELIDILADDYSDEVTVRNRPVSESERKNYSKYEESDKGYWTLWDGYLKLKKNEVGTALGSDGSKILGGPSWK
mgnify:CR=1 FL=1